MITADYSTLMRQAGMTAAVYMSDAIDEIDRAFGKGYAKGHPELVGAFMQTAASDYHAACLAVAIQEHTSMLQNKIYETASELMDRLGLPPRPTYC